MQCAPHTPYPHCTEPHCVPLFTPHPASKWQITTTEGGRRWMRMNECSHPLTTTPILPAHPLHLPASPYTTFIPHSLPLLSTAGLCYDCSWCVIAHIAVSTAPPWGHPYKGLSFPKVRSEPCTQVLSRHLVWRKEKRRKTACPYSLSVCLQWAWLLRPVSWVSFLFVFFSLLLLSSILSLLLYRKSVCAAYVFAAKGEAAVTSWYVCVFWNTKGWMWYSSF